MDVLSNPETTRLGNLTSPQRTVIHRTQCYSHTINRPFQRLPYYPIGQFATTSSHPINSHSPVCVPGG
jgi:hypothetical protein